MSDQSAPGSREPTVRLQSTPSDERPDSTVSTATGPRRLLLDEPVKDAIDAHVGADTSIEQGGVLVGDVGRDGASLKIVASVPARYAVGRPASLRFTHETWEYVNDVIAEEHPNLRMVGWYHSHPGFGIFLSEYDTFIHQNFFSTPWQVAYVVDPLLGQAGFFGWEEGRIVRYRRWHVLAHGSARSVREPVRGPDRASGAPPLVAGDQVTVDATAAGVPAESDPGMPNQAASEAAPTASSYRRGVNPWTAGLAAGLIGLLGGAAGYLLRGDDTSAAADRLVPVPASTPPTTPKSTPLRVETERAIRSDGSRLEVIVTITNHGEEPVTGDIYECLPARWSTTTNGSTSEPNLGERAWSGRSNLDDAASDQPANCPFALQPGQSITFIGTPPQSRDGENAWRMPEQRLFLFGSHLPGADAATPSIPDSAESGITEQGDANADHTPTSTPFDVTSVEPDNRDDDR